ncbi:MAG: translation initiation factor IF-5A [Thermoplasmata archaeon]|nr:translation initiation factor IF-5A [Thermoplasmata archaeon]
MSVTVAEVRELRVNRYMMIDNEPCKIVSLSTSKPGKHGEAKARIEAIGIFDNQKRSVVHPVKHKVQVPMISKRTAQVLSFSETLAQLMDLENYETFELPIPEDFKDKLTPGENIQYIDAVGRRMITRA